MAQHRTQPRPSLALADHFLAKAEEEAPALAKRLRGLDDEGRMNLAGVLGRFQRGSRQPELTAEERLLARRVLNLLRKPDTEVLALTNRVLDYLDLNANAILEENEQEHALGILAFFARADSVNDTLSERELRMLYAVLRHYDRNDNMKLDANERDQLHSALQDPTSFIDRQKHENPRLLKVLQDS